MRTIIYYTLAIIATVIYGIATMIAMISFVIGIIARDTARMGMWIDPERGREVNSSDEEDPPDKCN